jgi:hypothetical protein
LRWTVGRSRSPADLSGNSGKVSGSPPASHRSLYDWRDPPRHHEENLLDHGSPLGSPGYSTECDPSVLDMDSDNPDTSETTEDMSKEDGMIIDNVIDTDNKTVDPCTINAKLLVGCLLLTVLSASLMMAPLAQVRHRR